MAWSEVCKRAAGLLAAALLFLVCTSQALLDRATNLHNHTPKHNNQPVLELVDPTKEKRRPDDQLPEEIVLDRPSIVIGP